MLSQKIESDNK